MTRVSRPARIFVAAGDGMRIALAVGRRPNAQPPTEETMDKAKRPERPQDHPDRHDHPRDVERETTGGENGERSDREAIGRPVRLDDREAIGRPVRLEDEGDEDLPAPTRRDERQEGR
jgi:hypothetical protein